MLSISEELTNGNLRNVFEKPLLDELAETGVLSEVSEGQIIIDAGQYVKFIPILLSGNLKIIRRDEKEGEILLYYVGADETCAMSLTCCLAHQKSQIKAVAEEFTRMILIPLSKMESWMLKYPSWNNFVMKTYHNRFEELLKTIDSIAFHKVDDRLVKYLLEKQALSGSSIITVNHQQIADDLNSSREVISRLLKQLEKNGTVKLGRNKIEMMNRVPERK